MASEEGKSTCQYCSRSFSPAYLQTHVRRQHKIYGGVTGRIRRRPKEDFSVPTAHPEDNGATTIVVPAPPQHTPRFSIAPFVLLEDQDGGLWIAEKLR